MAIVPYYVTLAVAVALVPAWDSSAQFSGTTVFRAVRLIRVFRIFKLGRYSAGMQVFWGALVHSATSLSLLGFLIFISIILFSSVMYLVEDEGDLTPDECDPTLPGGRRCDFRTIPTTFWWAIVTMTTVGYGDVVPSSISGRIIACVTMICGIIVIALLSVLARFTKLMQQYSDESLIITQADVDGSSFVDAAEGRWLAAMRRRGACDERLTAADLIRKTTKAARSASSGASSCACPRRQGGPSNRELLMKMQRLGSQLEVIREQLAALEGVGGGGGAGGGGAGGGAADGAAGRDAAAKSFAAAAARPRAAAAAGGRRAALGGGGMMRYGRSTGGAAARYAPSRRREPSSPPSGDPHTHTERGSYVASRRGRAAPALRAALAGWRHRSRLPRETDPQRK